jgi:hypothetical protein
MAEHQILVDARADLDGRPPAAGVLGIDKAFGADIAERACNAVGSVGPATLSL